MTIHEEMTDLIGKLEEASFAYYALSQPIMSDKAYDELYDRLKLLEDRTGIILAGSPTQKVQGYVLKGFKKVTHSKPMLSAQKSKDINDVRKFLGMYYWYCSGKLDGNTLVVRYSDGKFVQGITRGNGTIGEDVTEACRFIKNLPMNIPWTSDLEVRGECVMSWDEFNRINEGLKDKYSHPRNLSSGTLRQLDLNVVKERELSFVAFESVTRLDSSKYAELYKLDSFGFETVIRQTEEMGLDSVAESMTKRVQSHKYPYDGLVFTIDNHTICDKLGSTAKFPNDLFALKWADTVYETTLLDVEWNPTKSGLLFPTAIVEPVDCEGACVSKVTLNNITYIKNLELGIGDTITIYRSNLVIPCIDDNLTRSNTLEIPKHCPVCRAETRIIKENDSEVLVCTNDNCRGKLLGRFVHFASKKGMDIDGLSEKTLETMIKFNMLHNFSDLYHPENWADKLRTIPGFGKRSVDKLLKAIEVSRTVTLDKFICALSIDGIGSVQAQNLASEFGTWEKFYETGLKGVPSYLTKVEGIGDKLARNVTIYLRTDYDLPYLCGLLTIVGTDSGSGAGDIRGEGLLEGKTFVITGKLAQFANRDTLVADIQAHGGKVAGSVSKNTSFLINNDSKSTSSKNLKAQQLGVAIITEEEYLEMVK